MINRLDQETSEYLKQHAGNPVFWQPWDDEALQAARTSGKPIFLSIGYSACHWCHVMAHESFEDPSTADVMNEHFICIKVDREERPDLDKVYQAAHQLLTRQTGGWPLSMFLDPDTLTPFFGGTYFPKTPRYQLPGFVDLLLRISEAFTTNRKDLTDQGEKLIRVLNALGASTQASDVADTDLLVAARSQLGSQYDTNHGGFGNAPKFPMPTAIDRLLRHSAHLKRHNDSDNPGLEMAMITLTKMARGGIFDHLGGGFCRYSTDNQWMIPHFEKMLYDNGQLLSVYADALTIGPDDLFESTVRMTVAWLLRDMSHPDGGFYAAVDADTEGSEGKYYVWRRDQVKQVLDEDEYLLMETLFGLDKPANFEGRWNLHRHDSWRSVVTRLSLGRPQADETLEIARNKLFNARMQRTPPAIDPKILTAWNALTISGLVKAGRALKEPAWIDRASEAADFLSTVMWRDDRLFASYTDGEARIPAYLDDYANLLNALLDLLGARWRDADYLLALNLAERVIADFSDPSAGGFFFSAQAHQTPVFRPKPTVDDSLPAANGVMATVLQRLGHLSAKPAYLDLAAGCFQWAKASVEHYPAGHCTLLSGLERTRDHELVIVRGPVAEIEAWVTELSNRYTPWRDVYAIPYEGVSHPPDYLPRLVSSEVRNRAVAFVCSGLSCSPPINDLASLKAQLA
ncbi:MAG: thioredoxin domain-containing protein [Proteobacteria bacterium]|nr:thioredoxin domain-containing protein [Pseudomonadota bacterium]